MEVWGESSHIQAGRKLPPQKVPAEEPIKSKLAGTARSGQAQRTSDKTVCTPQRGLISPTSCSPHPHPLCAAYLINLCK